MKKIGVPKLIAICLILMTIFSITKYAYAAFSVSVTPFQGGFDLRFGKISVAEQASNVEVVVSITSDIGKQYRLIQTLIEPLTNAQGNTMLSQKNLFVYGIRGSNKFGTLAVEEEIPVSLGRTILYTSNPTGESDSFTLVYGLRGPFEVPSGSYRGRIGFTLEPIDATQEPVTAILNIFAEIESESSIEIKTPTGSKSISLNAAREEARSSQVSVDILGGFGNQFKIIQSITEPLTSLDGKEFPYDVLSFVVSGLEKGSGPTQLTPLSGHDEVIYTSNPQGDAESFTIEYNLGDLSGQKAGKYRTRIRYLLEGFGAGGMGLIDTLDLEVENPPIFDLAITPELGGTIRFSEVTPLAPPKTYEVIFEIKSNLGRQYQVTQNTPSLLTNREGNIIPQKHFTLRQEDLGTKGILKYPNKTELAIGRMVLFISDKEGSSDKFKVIYELESPRSVLSGDYSTTFTYSITEI